MQGVEGITGNMHKLAIISVLRQDQSPTEWEGASAIDVMEGIVTKLKATIRTCVKIK